MQALKMDPYDVLSIPATASLGEIKLAYRKMAASFHPDRDPEPSAAERFRQAQMAYDLLSDEERRREHDQRRQKHLLEDPKQVARSIFQSYLESLE